MRTFLIAGAIAMLGVPAAIYAQSASTGQAMPDASSMPSDAMSGPASPMASDSSMASPMATTDAMSTAPSPAPSSYPVCSKTVKDECRNRGGK